MKVSKKIQIYSFAIAALLSSCSMYKTAINNQATPQSNPTNKERMYEAKNDRICINDKIGTNHGFLVKSETDNFELYENAKFEAYDPSGKKVGTAYTNFVGQGSVKLPDNYIVVFYSPKDSSVQVKKKVSDIEYMVNIPDPQSVSSFTGGQF